MKKIVSLILTLVMLCSLCVTPAFAGAAYNSDVTVSAALDKTALTTSSSAQTVVLTIKASKQVDLFSIGYKVEVPVGWSITGIESGSSAIVYSLDDDHYNLGKGRVSWYKGQNKSTDENGTIGKITISVPANAAADTYTINVTGIELATAGENSDNAWMSNGSTSASLTISEPKVLTGISVKTAPTKTDYVAGQNFDSTGMVIEKTYNDGSTVTATGWTVTDGTGLTAGKTTVTISYTEDGVTKTTTQAITVAAKAVTGISVSTVPAKTDYVAGQNFDSTDMVIEAAYNDGSTAVVNGWTVTDGTNLTTGKTTVTISYTENGVTKTTTQAITVVAKAVTGITVETAPTKTDYIDGQNFNPAGMVVKASYNDGTTADVTGSVTVTDGTGLTTGKTSVTISYTEGGVTKTTTQPITVTAKAVTGITVKTQPGKLTYNDGDNFNSTGMVITVTYNDDSTEDITSGFTVTPNRPLTITDTAVTVNYGGKTATIAVTVNAVRVTGVTLNKNSITLKVGNSERLTAAVEPANATNANVIWMSSNESVATVADGKVVAMKAGTAVITVLTEDGAYAASCTVTVKSQQIGPMINLNGCTLTFETNGGSVIKAVREVEGTVLSLKNYIPTKDGYIFDGWYSDKALTKRVDKITLNANTKVYAKWIEIGEEPEEPIEEPIEEDENGFPFDDVQETDWSYDDICYVWENGLMNGMSATTFAPKNNTSRAMIVTVLWRLEGSPYVNYAMSFEDVEPGQWYTEAIRWAQAENIVKGYSEAEFGPDNLITREQLAAIFYRYAEYKGYDVTARADLEAFEDADEIGAWAAENIAWANAVNLVNGTSATTLSPKANATREQVAAILHRFCVEFAE